MGHDQIKDWNQIGRVVFELSVKLRVMSVHVLAVDVDDLLFHVPDFLELLDVIGYSSELIIAAILVELLLLNEVVDEFLKLLLHFVSLDVGTPEHLGARDLAALHSMKMSRRGFLSGTGLAGKLRIADVVDAQESSLACKV